MRTVHKIGIGALVGAFFVVGYATRIQCVNRERAMALMQHQSTLGRGTQIASSQLSGVADVDIRPLQTLYSVLRNLQEHYVEQLTVEDEGRMTYDAMRGMLASFGDPNTRFIDREQRKLVSDAQEGSFHGIGAILAIRQTWKPNADKPKEPLSDEHLVVATLLPGSPAAKAGLKPGDEIIAINGKTVLPFNPYQRVSEMMKDPKIRKMDRGQLRKLLESEQKRIDEGTGVLDAEQLLGSNQTKPFELTLAAKPPAKESKITVRPEDLIVDPVSPVRMAADGCAYVRVGYFGSRTAAKFDEAMKDPQLKSAKGLILDLRAATGGDIESAARIASWLVPDETLAILLKSRGRRMSVMATVPQDAQRVAWAKPVVILVDRSTTRAPEVLAAGLKEDMGIKLVGEKTYGEFADTTVIDLADGSAVVMSTGKYVTAKGMDFNGKGVPVDVPAGSDDLQMRQAIRLLGEAGGKG